MCEIILALLRARVCRLKDVCIPYYQQKSAENSCLLYAVFVRTAIEGVWVTPELFHARDDGYRVLELHEVWNRKQGRKGLFAQYINKFFKAKMEAGGWRNTCNTAGKKEGLHRRSQREGYITLDLTRVENNPGRKAVAKLMLNSFWGKCGQGDNITQTKFIHEPKRNYSMCGSETVKIHDMYAVNPKCMMATPATREEHNKSNLGSNIAVAAFITLYARLKVLDMMERLGDCLLCYDMDSVILLKIQDNGSHQQGISWETGITSVKRGNPILYDSFLWPESVRL